MRSVWSERAKKSLHILEDYILRELIVISDIWDTRREPKAVAKGL